MRLCAPVCAPPAVRQPATTLGNSLLIATFVSAVDGFKAHYADRHDPQSCGQLRKNKQCVPFLIFANCLPVVRAILASDFAAQVMGILHCSGGGQTKCRGFGRGLHYVKDALFPTPPLFQAIQDAGIEPKQMYQVFNMGHRLELYVRPAAAAGVIAAAARFGVEAKVVGRIEAYPGSDANRVSIAANGQTFEYA